MIGGDVSSAMEEPPVLRNVNVMPQITQPALLIMVLCTSITRSATYSHCKVTYWPNNDVDHVMVLVVK